MDEGPEAVPAGAATPEQNLRRRALGGLLWMVSGAGAQALLRLLLLLALARLLGPEIFGIVGAALVVVNLSQVLCELGLGIALVQGTHVGPREVRTSFTAALLTSVVVALLIQLLAPAIAGFFDFDGLEDILRVLGLVPLISNLGLVAEALARRALAFRRLAVLSILSFALGYGVVGVALALVGAGVWALVAAHLIQTLLWAGSLLITQPHPKTPMLDRGVLPKLLLFSGGLTTWRISGAVAQSIDNIVVGRWLGAEALGLYGRAYQMTSMPTAILGRAVNFVLLPVMAKVKDDRPRVGLAYREGTALLALLTVPLSVLAAVLAPEVVLILLGADWTGVILPLQILAAGIFFRLSFRLSDSLATALGAVYAIAWRQTIYAAAVFTGAVLGQAFGLPGVAAGVLAALMLNFVLTTQLCMRLTALGPGAMARAYARPLAVGSLLALIVGSAAGACREYGLPAAATLAIALALAVVVALAVIRFRGGLLIGPEGQWLLRSLVGHLPARRAVARLLGLPERRPQRRDQARPVAWSAADLGPAVASAGSHKAPSSGP